MSQGMLAAAILAAIGAVGFLISLQFKPDPWDYRGDREALKDAVAASQRRNRLFAFAACALAVPLLLRLLSMAVLW